MKTVQIPVVCLVVLLGAEKIFCCKATKCHSAESVVERLVLSCGRHSREPPIMRSFGNLLSTRNKKHTRLGCVFCCAEKRICAFSGSFSRKVRISLRSVTHTSTYRRALISSLQGITNALLNGQLVPLDNYQLSTLLLGYRYQTW